MAAAREIPAKSLTCALEGEKQRGVADEELITLLLETNRMDTIRAASEHGATILMDVRSPVPITLPSRTSALPAGSAAA